MGGEQWKTIAPCLKHLTELIQRDGSLSGLCPGSIRIVDVNTSSSCSLLEKAPCGDRFKMRIPYAGVSIEWEVLFDLHQPHQAPDFIFSQEDKDFQVDLDMVPSLVHWNPKKPDSLLRVTEEVLHQYKEYHRSLVNHHVRLQFEYSSFIEQEQFREDDIEIHVGRKSEKKIGPVNFLIKLPINFARIPAILTKDNPGEDAAVLLISFHSPDSMNSKITPQLYLSPRVEHCIGGCSSLRVPPWPTGGCLMDYVPVVSRLLEKKVEKVIAGFEKRKDYIAAFLSHFGRSVIEYDMEGFSKISLMLEWNDFFFIFHVEVPTQFPEDPPTFTFQSIYHENSGKPYMKSSKDYPYSPRWSGNEMVERAWSYILDNIGGFQKASITGGSYN
ncbi:BRISC and BRCA1-A complex member 2-like [Lineus longissimus]|uniref:BRISC and BRCA1-A complex member 2-like n=1 Tax=Lineus longissimus TaxID=88925 RepID=UPI002B4C74A0